MPNTPIAVPFPVFVIAKAMTRLLFSMVTVFDVFALIESFAKDAGVLLFTVHVFIV